MSENLVQMTPYNKTLISRSAILTFKACDYKGYLSYYYNNHGITGEGLVLDLLVGTVVHRGLQHLLEHCRVHHPDGKFDEQCIDEAIEKARELWIEQISNHSLALKSADEYNRLDEIIPEQENLWEGLIRAWAIRKLPEILEKYIILEVEHEEVLETLSDLFIFLGKADGLFLGRPKNTDGTENKLVILSIKTASEFAAVTERDILHDMQGVSEWVCVEERVNKLFKDAKAYWDHGFKELGFLEQYCKDREDEITPELGRYFLWCLQNGEEPKIYAVQYEYLIKGRREQEPYKSGIYKQQSFLCHPYKMEALMVLNSGSVSMAADNYKWVNKKKGSMPKGWSKIDIDQDVGIKNWVEMLATGQIQPEEGDPLATILFTPNLVLRTEEEIAEWKVSTKFFVERLHSYLETLDKTLNESVSNSEKLYREAIWSFFPKNTKSCHNYYGRDCLFVKHCHELLTLEMGLNSGLYQVRTPHHDLEKEKFSEEGYISE